METCFLCDRLGDRVCNDCKNISFCSDNHYKYHKLNNKCAPFKVVNQIGKGKCLVATREISPSEVILIDTPIIQTPYTKSKAQCLQCSRKLSKSSHYICKGCGFPMCNKKCASGKLHQIECSILSKADFEAEIEDFNNNDDHYACIMPLSLKIFIFARSGP